MKPLAPRAKANIKHNPMSIITKVFTLNVYFLQFLLPNIIRTAFSESYKSWQKATIKANIWKTPQSKGTNQTSEGDSDMTLMLESLDQEFKIIKISMLSGPMEKVDNIQEQIGNISREMETLKKELKEKSRNKN